MIPPSITVTNTMDTALNLAGLSTVPAKQTRTIDLSLLQGSYQETLFRAIASSIRAGLLTSDFPLPATNEPLRRVAPDSNVLRETGEQLKARLKAEADADEAARAAHAAAEAASNADIAAKATAAAKLAAELHAAGPTVAAPLLVTPTVQKDRASWAEALPTMSYGNHLAVSKVTIEEAPLAPLAKADTIVPNTPQPADVLAI